MVEKVNNVLHLAKVEKTHLLWFFYCFMQGIVYTKKMINLYSKFFYLNAIFESNQPQF